jgi:hypothetical protein
MFMKQPNAVPTICKPPAVAACPSDGAPCTCAVIGRPFPVCEAPQVARCEGLACVCVIPPPAPVIVEAPAEDACSIVVTMIVAGIKKSLLACWVTE